MRKQPLMTVLYRPPSTWFLPNFSVLFGTAMLPYFWWTTIFLVYLQYWQQIFHWTPLKAAVHVCVTFPGLRPAVVADSLFK